MSRVEDIGIWRAKGPDLAAHYSIRHRVFVLEQRVLELTEPERVHQRDRTGAHRENVTNDAADTGCRALIGFDERGVVVRLDFEDGGKPVSDVNSPCVLAWALKHPGAGRWKLAEVNP